MCEYCEPYNEKCIEGQKGYGYLTKKGEIVVFPQTDCVSAVHLKIKFCPMCGRKYGDT